MRVLCFGDVHSGASDRSDEDVDRAGAVVGAITVLARELARHDQRDMTSA